MKNSSGAQSATSLARAPRDEVSARSTRYLITMGIRVACFILMVSVQPYNWYTWLFGAAAVVLPYIAVVGANVGQESRSPAPESPERALPPTPAAPPAPSVDVSTQVIRVEEHRERPGDADASTKPDAAA